MLNICSVLPKVQLILCEPTFKTPDVQNNMLMEQPYYNYTVNLDGFMKTMLENSFYESMQYDPLLNNIIMAEMSLIITCVCVPFHRVCNFNFQYLNLFISIIYFFLNLLILYFWINIIFKEDENKELYSFNESHNKPINNDPLFKIICNSIRRHNGIFVSLFE